MHSSTDMYSKMKLKLIKLTRYRFVRTFNNINATDSGGEAGKCHQKRQDSLDIGISKARLTSIAKPKIQVHIYILNLL